MRPRDGERHAPSERFEHRLHPVSGGVAVPIFALAATGISLAAVADAVNDEVALGVFAGLLLGKVAGIFGAARLLVRLGLGSLPDSRSMNGAAAHADRRLDADASSDIAQPALGVEPR